MKFGDIVANGWASRRNPHRVAMVIRKIHGRVQVTDGNAVWYMNLDKDHKMKVIGSVDMRPYRDAVEEERDVDSNS